MGLGDKIGNTAEEAAVKAKEKAVSATDSERLEADGAKDQTAADVQQAGERLNDAARGSTEH
jgi:uncharacterized protein YjbJ (UPF0337 family)